LSTGYFHRLYSMQWAGSNSFAGFNFPGIILMRPHRCDVF
jgi:hypothetical protein